MPNNYFQFKEFTVQQDRCAMKVTTDACLFGAWVAQQLRKEKGIENLLDAGAGTGLLSLMIEQKNPVTIEAIEIDPEAKLQCEENIADSPWRSYITVQEGDIRNHKFTHSFNAVVSNPPFYENELSSPNKRRNIAYHSKQLTLDQLLIAIKNNLDLDGVFYLLLPFKRNNEIKELLLGHSVSVQHLCFVRPGPEQEFFRIMLAGRVKTDGPVMTLIDEISIIDGNEEYTPEFVALLKDYYLKL